MIHLRRRYPAPLIGQIKPGLSLRRSVAQFGEHGAGRGVDGGGYC